MSKSLTIEELKSLEVGDWVWITDSKSKLGTYARKCVCYGDDEFRYETIETYEAYLYSNYGTKWLAYKNKEQAEAKGEVVEIPCIRKVVADDIEKYHVYHIGKCGLYKNVIMYDWCDTYEQAEARLKELRGEK